MIYNNNEVMTDTDVVVHKIRASNNYEFMQATMQTCRIYKTSMPIANAVKWGMSLYVECLPAVHALTDLNVL